MAVIGSANVPDYTGDGDAKELALTGEVEILSVTSCWPVLDAGRHGQVQVLDGTWETWAQVATYGPRTSRRRRTSSGSRPASFDLKRDPSRPWPDLPPFTPVEVEVDGLVVWEGRTIEAPSRDGAEKVMSVQCEGWQHHLDDDLIDGFYVHRRLADWKDARGYPEENLTLFTTAGSVEASGGMLTLDGRAVPFYLPVRTWASSWISAPDVPQRRSRSRSKGSPGQRTAGAAFSLRAATSDYWGVGNAPSISPTLASIGTNPNLYQDDFPTRPRPGS